MLFNADPSSSNEGVGVAPYARNIIQHGTDNNKENMVGGKNK